MTTGRRPGRRIGWELGLGRELALAFWGVFFLEAAFGSYMGIWPLWIERLGAPVTVVGLVLGSAGVLRLFVLLPSAALAERFGARRLIIAGRSAAFVGLIGAALATNWPQLAVMVVGSAVGEVAFPLVQAHVAGHAGERRVRALMLVFTVGPSLALIAAPLLAGLLIELTSLRAAFLLAAACTTASIACFWRMSSDDSSGLASAAPVATYRDALGDRAVRRLVALQGTTIFALALGTSLVPTFLEDERGLSPSTIATLGALAAVGSAVFGLVVTRVHRLQRSPFVAAAIAVGVTGLGFVLFLGSEAALLIGLAYVCRGGLFSAWALFAAAVGDTASAANRSRSFALSELAGGFSFALAPMAAGSMYAANSSGPLLLATVLAAVLVPVLLVMQRVTSRDQLQRSNAAIQDQAETRSSSAEASAS